jgi:hypothetical protein
LLAKIWVAKKRVVGSPKATRMPSPLQTYS